MKGAKLIEPYYQFPVNAVYHHDLLRGRRNTHNLFWERPKEVNEVVWSPKSYADFKMDCSPSDVCVLYWRISCPDAI